MDHHSRTEGKDKKDKHEDSLNNGRHTAIFGLQEKQACHANLFDIKTHD